MRLKWLIAQIAMLIILLPAIASAATTPGIYVNGERVAGGGAPIQIKSDTYIPLHVVTAHLRIGGNVTGSGDKFYFLPSGTAFRAELAVVDKSYYMPVRYLADEYGMKFTRDRLTGSVYLFDRAIAPPSPEKPEQEQPPTGDPSVDNPSQENPSAEQPQAIDPGDGQPDNGGGASPSTEAPGGIAIVHTLIASGDSLVLQADRRLEPTVFHLSNPARIVLDVPYSRFADNSSGVPPTQSGVLTSDHPYIEQIRYALFSNEPSTLRFVVDLKQNMPYEVNTDETGRLTLTIPYGTVRVAIDAGHGGHDPGSPGASKGEEKLFTLSLSNKVYDLLMQERDIVPVMLRSDDTYISPIDRAMKANSEEVDLFVSIHANSFANQNVRGTETYYHHEHSKRLAEIMHENIIAATGFPDRNVKKMNYLVTKETTMPSVLLEIGYLSNPQEEAQLHNEEVQNRVAAAIVASIKQYLTERQP